MALVVPEYTFPFSKRSKYPWQLWLNGETWRLESGTDFPCQSRSFAAAAYDRARKDGVGLQIHLVIEDGYEVVYLRAIAATGEPEKKTTTA